MPLAEHPSSVPGPTPSSAVLLTDSLEKPSLDDRDYRVIRLDNELEALLVHDPETDKASAALDVNVGNFSDEDSMPGMAHAVEHLLFMGTKKFPVENEYSQYLSANSGSSNAYTASTSTNYYFEVAAKPADDQDPTAENPSPLHGALDRFSQFFIEPLFLPSTLDRELRAVDSENKKNLQNDTWRLHQLDKSLSNARHPYCHFSTGNLEVLKIDPESQGINVREKFIEFHDKHYSANRMKLVVLGRESLDLLQKWAEEFFSPIVNKNLPQNRWEHEVPYNNEDLGTRCFAKPVMDSRELNLIFPFINEEYLYESQPSRYISHLLGHEGPGSIMSYIKNKGWANSLSAGAYPICPGTPGLFDISIRLTEEGLKKYPEIVKVIFQYVSLLRETSPQKWIFEEQRGMADVDFKFKQKTPASRFTSRVSSVMQKPIPREWLLSGQSRLRTFEPEKIKEALATIRPDNLKLSIVSRNYPGDWDQKEKWYGTEYKYEKLPADLMADFKAALATSSDRRIPELHIPHKNNFIPNELEVEKKDVANPALSPRLLRNDDLARTWWKKDDAFWVPRANVVVSLKSPIIYASAENVVKARLFTELIRDALEEYAYDADLAGLQYSVTLGSRGLLLNLSGYNDKLLVLLQQVSTTMRDLDIQTDRFDVVKERLTRAYSNWQLNSAYQQVGEYLNYLNSERDFLVEELASELPDISLEAVRLFQKQVLSQMYIETYAHGNLHKEDALKVTSLLESTFRPRALPHAQIPIVRSLLLPVGSNYVYNKTLLDPANINHCVETWLHVGDRKDRDLRAKTLLFDQLSHEPAFDQLRTKEQLGYIVFTGIRNFATTCGLRVLIQSEKTPEYLDQRIEAFLTQIGTIIENMSDADFEGHKRSLIIKQLEKPRNLDQESSRHWTHIAVEYYDFEQAQLDAAYIKPLTKAEILEFYREFFCPSSNKRARISVHLHARGAGELDTKTTEAIKSGVKPAASESHQGSHPNGSKAAVPATDITDLRRFKSGLMVSQGARPVKDLIATGQLDSTARPCPLELSNPFRLPRFPSPSTLHPPSSDHSELHEQPAFKTSSSKKRRVSSRPPPLDRIDDEYPSSNTAIPSCEPPDDPTFSFSASGTNTPSYVSAHSQPASSLPPRLQPNGSFPASADYTSSRESSPSTSAYADLSLDSDKGGDDTGLLASQRGGRPSVNTSWRAVMNGDTDLPQRSSSPLKRRASSMDPDADPRGKDGAGDASTEQGLPRAMSIDPPEFHGTEGVNGQTGTTPPIHEQVKIIETLLLASKDAPLKEGDKAYLVSRSWVEKALAWGAGSKQQMMNDAEAITLGPVDNSDIVEEIIKDSTDADFIRLKPGSGLESFELFPEDAWNMVVEWYGLKEGQAPIVRTAINDAPDAQSKANILYELHPPIFCIHRLWSILSPLPIEQSLKAKNPPPIVLARSRKTGAQKFLKSVKSLAGIPLERKVRMFSISQPIPIENNATAVVAAATTTNKSTETLTPPDSPQESSADEKLGAWTHLLLDTAAFSHVRDMRMEVPLTDQTNNDKYNGKSTIQHWDLVTDQTLVLDEAIDDGWVSTYNKKKASKVLPKSNTSALSSRPSSGRSSPAPLVSSARGRALRKRTGKSLGAVGLQNLGNTCYMNSALQCVRSVEELTKYFLTDSHVDEINKSNPLGYNGRVAIAYVSLLKEIYNEGRGSVSPRDFKTTVGRCRSTFQGWGQQDSQEFLGFLLDGLQEDLSRIKNKPYIEKPDSTDDMIDNPEAIRKMAEEVWDITRRRDDSVIADLFTGMYKSTLNCPECGKVSITFDPFNNLTLPLPVENMWANTVKFFPLNDVPVKFEVELPKHSALELLKQFVSERTGVPVDRLMGAEEFKDRFFKIYHNQHDISEEIQGSDHPTIHELEMAPTNWPSKGKVKKFKSMIDIESTPDNEWDDPRYERMVIPVFHRRSPGSGSGREGVAPPHFIVVTREEAFDYERIRRKVLEKVATLSTWSALVDETETDSSKTVDSDTVIVPSDADSSGDSRVAARSVGDEDDMVDVAMKDALDNPAFQSSTPDSSSKILKHFNKVKPSFMDADGFLDPMLQNLFDLSYFMDSSDGAVPSGWSQVDSGRHLPKLSDRMPQVEENEPSPEGWGSAPSGNEESSNDEDQKPETPQTRMLEESSEEDASPARTGRRGQGHQKGSKKKLVDHRNRGKKFNKRREKSMRANKEDQRSVTAIRPQPMPTAVADGGPLIRLGEGLVVDWNDEAWDTVFGQSVFDRSQKDGTKKLPDMETVYDEALHAAQTRRQTRRSRGITFEECLDEFERAEILSEDDKWYCPRCKEHRRASKKFELWKSPDILVAHLKRFSSSGYRRDKLDVLVDFPIENLDLTSRVIEKEVGRDEIYDLIAVDDHYGGLGGGHYTAYAKNFVDGRWYSYNDSSVSQVSDPSVAVTSAAYLLFYRRRSKIPLGGPRFTEIGRKFDRHNESDEDSDTEIGEGDQSNAVYYQNNRLSIEGKPAVFRPRGDRESATTTVTPLANSDGDDEDELPPYTNTIHPSVEDEGVEMADNDHLIGSNPLAQGWSFGGLGGNTHDNSVGDDTASDKVQVDSTDDEQRGTSQLRDGDVEMNFVTTSLSDTEDGLAVHGHRGDKGHKDGVPLPTKRYNGVDPDEVTEIHVDGDNKP